MDVYLSPSGAELNQEVLMRGPEVGLALLLGFVGTQAIRDVYLGHLFGNLGIFEVALLAFGTTAAACGTVLLLFGRQQWTLLRANWRGVLALNATTSLAWLSYFGALRLVEPAAANLAFCGVAPISVAALGLFGLVSSGERVPSIAGRVTHWVLLGVVLLLAVAEAAGWTGNMRQGPSVGFAGVALAAFAGLTITAESIFAKRMNLVGITPASIIGVRFILVTAISGIMVALGGTSYHGLSTGEIAWHGVIFLGILIGPIYLAQTGLALTTPLTSSVILSVGPIVTLALQSTAGGLVIAPALVAITMIYGAISIAAAVVGAKVSAVKSPQQDAV
jgi:hypothetical protein